MCLCKFSCSCQLSSYHQAHGAYAQMIGTTGGMIVIMGGAPFVGKFFGGGCMMKERLETTSCPILSPLHS